MYVHTHIYIYIHMDKYIHIHTCIELYITVLILAQHHTCQSESRVRCQKWFHFFHLDSGRISLPHDTLLRTCCFGPKFHWDIAGLLRSFCKLRIQRNIGKLKPIIDLPAHSKILKMLWIKSIYPQEWMVSEFQM